MENVGRYRIIVELGRGGMATVYKAYDPQFDREVAIKILPPQFLHDPSFSKRFFDEARTIARLEHRCILPVYDFGQADGVPYIVMRLMAHGSLSEAIRAIGPMPFNRVAHIVTQVATALDYAHSRNIIHRDLKPANLLLDEAGNVYLSDFGLAKLVGESNQGQGTLVAGTPAYMAPEQARGQMPTPRTDVYALGALAFELLGGKAPFQAPDILALMYLHAHEQVPNVKEFRPDVPDGVQTVLEQAMAKEAERRYASAGALASALIRQLGQADELHAVGQGLRPLQQGRSGPPSKTILTSAAHGRPWRFWLVVVLLGLIGISLCGVILASMGRLANALGVLGATSTVTQVPIPTEAPVTPTALVATQTSVMTPASLTPNPISPTTTPNETLTISAQETQLAQATGTSQAQFTGTSQAFSTGTAQAKATLAIRAYRTAAAATAAAAAQGLEITIQSTQPWQNSGISLTSGQELTIDYVSGQWTTCVSCGGGYFDGTGRPGRPTISDVYGCNFMSLVARIGSSGPLPYICVGNHFDGRVQASGPLLFQVTDNNLSDNDGQIVVKVVVR